MSQFFASVNGLQIVAGTLMIPLVGCWTADLTLASSTTISGNVTVIIGKPLDFTKEREAAIAMDRNSEEYRRLCINIAKAVENNVRKLLQQ